MERADSLEKTLILGKVEGRRRGWQRTRCLNGITESIDMSLSKLWSWWWTRKLGVLQSMWSQRVQHDWVTELNWKEKLEHPCVCVQSHFSHVWLFVTLWTVAHQASQSMEFSKQEYWSELPCPTPGDFPEPGIEPMSMRLLHCRQIFYHNATGEALGRS